VSPTVQLTTENGRSAVSSQDSDVSTEGAGAAEFGANEWLVDEMYSRYLADKNSVDKSWWPILEKYQQVEGDIDGAVGNESSAPGAPTAPAAQAPPAESAPTAGPPTGPITVQPGTQPIAKTTSVEAKPQPIPAEAPSTATEPEAPVDDEPQDVITPLRGMAKAIASNMDSSLTVPTATSVRTVPAKLMIDNRIVINNRLKGARGCKV